MSLKKSKNHLTMKVLSISGIMIITGTILTLGLKYQDKENFKHPFIMVQETMLGELIALFWFICPFFFSKKKLLCHINRSKQEIEKRYCRMRPSIFWIGIGGIIDTISSCFQIMGLIFLPTPIYLLMKTGTFISTVIFSIIVLRFRHTRMHWIGLLLIIGGLVVIAFANIIIETKKMGKSITIDLKTYFGLLAMTISVFISGFHIVYQEFLFRCYSIEPKELIGLEGLFGMILATCILILASKLPCEYVSICDVGKSLDSPAEAMIMIFSDWKLLTIVYTSISAALIFNLCGAILIKTKSAIFRMVIDSFRGVVTWILLTIVEFEEAHFWKIFYQTCGLILLIFGTCVYNGIFNDHSSFSSSQNLP